MKDFKSINIVGDKTKKNRTEVSGGKKKRRHSVLEILYLKWHLKPPRKRCPEAALNIDLDKRRKE